MGPANVQKQLAQLIGDTVGMPTITSSPGLEGAKPVLFVRVIPALQGGHGECPCARGTGRSKSFLAQDAKSLLELAVVEITTQQSTDDLDTKQGHLLAPVAWFQIMHHISSSKGAPSTIDDVLDVMPCTRIKRERSAMMGKISLLEKYRSTSHKLLQRRPGRRWKDVVFREARDRRYAG